MAHISCVILRLMDAVSSRIDEVGNDKKNEVEKE
jgi:hypothetical protein